MGCMLKERKVIIDPSSYPFPASKGKSGLQPNGLSRGDQGADACGADVPRFCQQGHGCSERAGLAGEVLSK